MLVKMKEILDRACKENYAVAAANVYTELNARAFVEAAEELNAPLILNYKVGCHPDTDDIIKICLDLAKKSKVPIAVNLDHGDSKEMVLSGIRAGVTGVMIDKSSKPFEENVKETKKVVEIAHTVGVSVEAELGHVGVADNYVVDGKSALTKVEDAVRFVELTDVDCLAVAIGTAHGAYPKGMKPEIDFERLASLRKALPELPLVLHGSSGTDIEDIRKVCSMGINKVNVSNDLCRAAIEAAQKNDFGGNAAYKFFATISNAIKQSLKELIKVYGSENKAWTVIPKGLNQQ